MAGAQTTYIGAIDEGTSSSRFLLFEAGTGKLISQSQKEVCSQYPHEGWCEQDPVEILQKTVSCMQEVVTVAASLGIQQGQIKAIGITNQRETTVVWDKVTGKPLCNAIVWLDIRTTQTVEKLIKGTPTNDQCYLQKKCGLPISTYFSAVKLRWILDNLPDVQKAVDEGRCLFGTIDSWLVWNLTGGAGGGQHITDVTNASRTMLMNLDTLDWDSDLCQFFGISQSTLPQIKSSSEIYGYVTGEVLNGVAISGILGDQQAALVGHGCLQKGSVKNTYGTGNFLLYNTGLDKAFSSHGMLTTVAYKFGRDEPAKFALEGSVAVTGAAVKWLRDNLELIQTAKETEEIASQVKDSGGVFFVPAFSGLYAPYWRPDARGLVIGLTHFTRKVHLVRATLEAVCYQSAEILEAMNQDSGIQIEEINVDGGMTINKLLMQMQADILGIPVKCPAMPETTALGAAIAAGAAKGIDAWSLDQVNQNTTNMIKFLPKLDKNIRKGMYQRWKEAVQRAIGWEKTS